MKLHVLKIERNFYDAVVMGSKKAELRKDDRDYKVGDLIHFTDIKGDEYDGEFNLFVITHVLPARSVIVEAQDYVILSITNYRGGRIGTNYETERISWMETPEEA